MRCWRSSGSETPYSGKQGVSETGYNASMPKHYRAWMSRTAFRQLLRILRRAVDPVRGYTFPALSRLHTGRLETLLDVMEASEIRQRARVLTLTRRQASTLHSFSGWCLRENRTTSPSVRSIRRRAGWLIGLDA